MTIQRVRCLFRHLSIRSMSSLAFVSTNALPMTHKLPIFQQMFTLNDSSVHNWFENNSLSNQEAKELVSRLLATPSFDPTAIESRVFRWACLYHHYHAIQLLVMDNRIDPTTQDYFGVRVAIKRNRDIVELLCAKYPLVYDRIVDLTQQVFIEACHFGQLAAIQYMLSDPRLLVSTLHTAIAEMTFIDTVCSYAKLEWEAKHNMTMEVVASVVKLVMTHAKFDPSDRESRIFRWFCAGNDIDMVQYLLADKRVDPSAKSSAAYFLAKGNPRMTALLLQDGRVDVAAANALHSFVE